MKLFRRSLIAAAAAVLMPAAVLAQNLVIKSHDTHPAGYPTVAAI
jgi:hemolysin-activating ACP:hemolysin acyltransferase